LYHGFPVYEGNGGIKKIYHINNLLPGRL
jgi:hypothetical protein